MKNKHLYEELKYQATSLVLECEQKLNWEYFSSAYAQEKIDKIVTLLKEINKK